MKWITRERPKIDRIACPWLIKRFIDPEAEFLYVPYQDVITISKKLNAIPSISLKLSLPITERTAHR